MMAIIESHSAKCVALSVQNEKLTNSKSEAEMQLKSVYSNIGSTKRKGFIK